MVIIGFSVLIATGTLLLRLPFAHETTAPQVSLFDAFFTSVSATTVTGLAVVDTGATFSRFGELVILTMIQIGGLGIMTLASLATVFLSRRLGIKRGLLAGTEIGLGDFGELRPVIRAIFRYTLAFEGLAAATLSIRFILEDEHTIGGSIYLGVFHAISAFNNAGFSVLGGGLGRYVTDPWVNVIVSIAIISGGLGFPVATELSHHFRQPRQWSLHTKVTIVATTLLIVGGTVAILAIEWTNPATMGNLSVPQKVLSSFFQSVTTRTAGFNTVPIGALRGGSILLMLLLMMIGASSASTGGGIKTSTFAVVVWTSIAEFRGDTEVNLFHRRLSSSLQRQALALVIAALGTVGTATFLLSLSQPKLTLQSLLFEAASAFGTVGLSTGITTELNTFSRLLIMALMFIGRVGPVTFGTAILFRSRPHMFRYPEDAPVVG
ncbi:MAG: potassium transporter TrkG [Acidimicrobiales bacterium]